MKRMLAVFFGATMLLATVGVATASAGHEAKDGPGPNGHNNNGLCTAFFNGQKKGHDKKESYPPPFAAMGGNDNAIAEFCEAHIIRGNPDDNGRFVCEEVDGEFECSGERKEPS